MNEEAVPTSPSPAQGGADDAQRRLGSSALSRPLPSEPAATATAPLRGSLAPLNRRSNAAPTQPPPDVFYTYPRATAARNVTAAAEDGASSPGPLRPASATAAPAASDESMELAVVPFVSPRHDPAHLAGGHRGAPHSERGGGVHEGAPGGPYYAEGPASYGELAPVTVSTERVCPHCLRPYGLYDTVDDDYGDLFDPANAFFLGKQGTPQPRTRQLPPPPALPAPSTSPPSPRQTQEGAPVGAMQSPGGPPFSKRGRADDETGGSPYPPPAVAFTAHYFRALPPPAAIAAAAAAGTSPLAIECYGSSDLLEDEEQVAQRQPRGYAAVFAGSGGGSGGGAYTRGLNGAVVPHTRALASPLQLMQSEEESEGTGGRGLLPDPERRPPPLMDDVVPDKGGEEEEAQGLDEASPTSSAYSPNAPGPAPSNGYYRHYFKELRQLGRGTFGGVYLCRHLMCGVSLGDFALKKIPVGDKAGYLQSVLREVRILEEVRRHPNVVEYKHSWVEDAQLADFGPPVRCLFILMEYASAGALDAYLDRHGSDLSTLAVWYFFLSAVAGTAHLHQKQILHRDLKPQNLLLAESKGRPPRVLVSDFGTAALLGDITYERSGGTGTLEYMAPELFEMAASPRGVNGEHYVNHHTVASDVWSLGMILHYLAFGATLPDRREDGSVVLDSPRQASYGRPTEMLRLVAAMLQSDPAKRPRCTDILGLPFVQSILRTFNQDDPTQWDMAAQQQERARRGTGVATAPPTPPPPPTRSRHKITVMPTTTAAGLVLRRGRQSGSQDSDTSDNENLLSSRVVELQSTMALLDLAGVRPASGSTGGEEGGETALLQGSLSSHGRGRHTRRQSPTHTRQEGRLPAARSSASSQARPSQSGSVASPLNTTPPPQLVDEAVQTDPVTIVDAAAEVPQTPYLQS